MSAGAQQLPLRRRRNGKALVLTGGGALGAFQIGALRRLYETGYSPDLICGIFFGAINAAKLAEGGDAIDELYGIWERLADGSLPITNEFAGVEELERRLAAFLNDAAAALGVQITLLPPGFSTATVETTLAKTAHDLPQVAFSAAKFLHAIGSVGDGVPNGFRGLRELIRENIRPERIRDSGILLELGRSILRVAVYGRRPSRSRRTGLTRSRAELSRQHGPLDLSANRIYSVIRKCATLGDG
jgi:hypothetical protein